MCEREKQVRATEIIVKAIVVEALRRDSGSLLRDLYAVLMDVSNSIGKHMDGAKVEGGG